MFDNNVLNLFLLLSASDNEGKELNATFKTSIAPVQTIHTTWTFHRQTQTAVFFHWLMVFHWSQSALSSAFWDRLDYVSPCLFGHYYKPSPTRSLKLPSLHLSNCWSNRYFGVQATYSGIHQQSNILPRVHNWQLVFHAKLQSFIWRQSALIVSLLLGFHCVTKSSWKKVDVRWCS